MVTGKAHTVFLSNPNYYYKAFQLSNLRVNFNYEKIIQKLDKCTNFRGYLEYNYIDNSILSINIHKYLTYECILSVIKTSNPKVYYFISTDFIRFFNEKCDLLICIQINREKVKVFFNSSHSCFLKFFEF